MCLRYLVLSFISIGCFFMSSMTVESQESPPRIASKPMSLVWNIHLQDMSDRWSLAYPERQTPRAEIRSLREETLSDEQDLDDKFEYLDKKFDVAAKAGKEEEKNEMRNQIATRNLLFPILQIIDSRGPPECSEGYQWVNNRKECREQIP